MSHLYTLKEKWNLLKVMIMGEELEKINIYMTKESYHTCFKGHSGSYWFECSSSFGNFAGDWPGGGWFGIRFAAWEATHFLRPCWWLATNLEKICIQPTQKSAEKIACTKVLRKNRITVRRYEMAKFSKLRAVIQGQNTWNLCFIFVSNYLL